MSSSTKLRAYLYASVAVGAVSIASTNAYAVCNGGGAPATAQSKCVTAIVIPGNSLQSFDISWANPQRAEYYLGDRANKGVDVIDTNTLTFKRTLGGFVGIKFNATGTVIDNAHSGPDGVVSHGRWLYAGDGDSTLKVFNLDSASLSAVVSIPTGGTTRVDEMAIGPSGNRLLVANNAEDPPFGTLFRANGDSTTNTMSTASIISKILVDQTFILTGNGQSIEQPAWDPNTKRFLVSVPQILTNPAGCTLTGDNTVVPQIPICQGGLLVIDPNVVTGPTYTLHAFDKTTNIGVLPLHDCGPNGASVGLNGRTMLGCTPGNVATNTTTQVINSKTKNFAESGGITGSDEVFFNAGDAEFYLGASKAIAPPAPTVTGKSVMGVVSGNTNILIETVPASSNSHSVATDSQRNLIFLPEVCTTAPPAPGIAGAPANVGCDTNKTVATGNTVSQDMCGSPNGCIAVYKHTFADCEDTDHDCDENTPGH